MTDVTTTSERSGPGLALGAGFLLWFAAIFLLARAGAFTTVPGMPPAALAAAALLPPLAFLAAVTASPALRTRVAALDPVLLVGAHAWRMVGLSFLFAWATGVLPAVFAVPAALGDAAIAVAALVTARAVARAAPGWPAMVRRLIAFGLLDFAVAFAAAILSGPGGILNLAGAPSSAMIQQLPYVLIPTFGVPVFICLHIASWIGLRAEAPRIGQRRT